MDNYKIIKFLGEGGFGRVNLVEDSEGHHFAMKEIDFSKLSDKDKERAINEIEFGKSFDHKNICKVIHSKKEGNYINILMEFCNGGDLKKYIKNIKGNEQTAQYIIKNLLDGLEYLHKTKSIVHRDIKPENILINFPKENINKDINQLNYEVKLADFGISKKIEEEQETSSQCGTYDYMDPRMLKKKAYSFEADIFSLGVTYFRILTGKKPYRLHKIGDKLDISKIKKGRYEFKDDIPHSKEAISLCESMLQKKRKNRISLEKIKEHPFMNEDTNNFKKVLKNQKLSLKHKYFTMEHEKKDVQSLLNVPICNQDNRKGNNSVINLSDDFRSTLFTTYEEIKKIIRNNPENNP